MPDTFKAAYLSLRHLTSEARGELLDPDRVVIFKHPIALVTNRNVLWVDVVECERLDVDTGYESFNDCLDWAHSEGLRMLVFSDHGQVVEDLTIYEED